MDGVLALVELTVYCMQGYTNKAQACVDANMDALMRTPYASVELDLAEGEQLGEQNVKCCFRLVVHLLDLPSASSPSICGTCNRSTRFAPVVYTCSRAEKDSLLQRLFIG